MQTTNSTITWPTISEALLDGRPMGHAVAPDSNEASNNAMEVDEIPPSLPGDCQALDTSKRYQLVVLGRGEGKSRQDVLIRLPQALLNKLADLANGSRSILIEMAVHHMVNELTQARERGEPVMMVEARDLQEKLEQEIAADAEVKTKDASPSDPIPQVPLVFPVLPDLPCDAVEDGHFAFQQEELNRRSNFRPTERTSAIRAPHLRRPVNGQRAGWNSSAGTTGASVGGGIES